jgi:tetratricopeptide (TPR) repeat protein
MLADQFEDAIRVGEQALAMSERLGLDELRAHALNNIGTARDSLGDQRGLAELEQAAELAKAIRSQEAARALNNLSVLYASRGNFTRQGEILREAIRVGEELGAVAIARFARGSLVGNLFWTGSWDEGLRLAEAYLAPSEGGSLTSELGVRRNRARVRLARDDVDGALADIETAVEGSREMGESQVFFPALGAAALIYVELGRDDEARELAAELIDRMRGAADWRILDFAFVAQRLGYADDLRPLIERLPPSPMRAANLALITGDHRTAAKLLAEGGLIFTAADARRLAAEKLAADDRRAEAEAELEQALAFYRTVGATRYIRQAEALLDDVSEVPA